MQQLEVSLEKEKKKNQRLQKLCNELTLSMNKMNKENDTLFKENELMTKKLRIAERNWKEEEDKR